MADDLAETHKLVFNPNFPKGQMSYDGEMYETCIPIVGGTKFEGVMRLHFARVEDQTFHEAVKNGIIRKVPSGEDSE